MTRIDHPGNPPAPIGVWSVGCKWAFTLRTNVELFNPVGAAEPALPGRRRSGPSGAGRYAKRATVGVNL